MDFILISAVVLAAFLALNIGANNSAASMATAYGAGVRTKRQAVIIIAVFALLGALIAGAPVVKTLGNGLVPSEVLSSHIGLVLIIFVIASIFVTWANVAKVPIATTHAIVCAIAGVGLYSSSLHTDKFFEILIWWIAAPLVAWIINFLMARYLYFRTLKYLTEKYSEKSINRILMPMITVSGTFLAFSAGANNGKEITEICILRAVSVEFTGAGLILLASFSGIPVSIAEIITSGIIGFSCAQKGFGVTARNRHVLTIAFFWIVIPFIAIAMGYGLTSLYFSYNVGEFITLNFGL